jgi:hypothetical protein
MKNHEFWTAFSNEARRLASKFLSGEEQEVFAIVETMLERHGFGYCFDITADDQTCCLVLSPEGDAGAAKAIDSLVSSAPPIPGWKVFGRRQRKHIADVRAILKQLYLVDVLQCRFRCSTKDKPYKTEIFIPSSSDLSPDEQRGFANTLLWHAIGEEQVMNQGLLSVVRVGIPRSHKTLSAQEFVQKCLDLGSE